MVNFASTGDFYINGSVNAVVNDNGSLWASNLSNAQNVGEHLIMDVEGT